MSTKTISFCTLLLFVCGALFPVGCTVSSDEDPAPEAEVAAPANEEITDTEVVTDEVPSDNDTSVSNQEELAKALDETETELAIEAEFVCTFATVGKTSSSRREVVIVCRWGYQEILCDGFNQDRVCRRRV